MKFSSQLLSILKVTLSNFDETYLFVLAALKLWTFYHTCGSYSAISGTLEN